MLSIRRPDEGGLIDHDGNRCGAHHRRAREARVLPRGLREHREASRSLAGCLDFAITADLVDPGRVNIFERWEAQAALESARSSAPPFEQAEAMLSVSVADYDVADVRPLFGESTA